MGTEITQEDLENIQALAEQVVSFTEYRQQLGSYLSARMQAIAPNLTTLVGDLVGARLIAHAGSLMNLSKSPASTIQILGAEKALFRALKTKHDTPKYGLIYHASLIGQATGKNKGKMARILAAKAAIGLRVDALQDWGENEESIPEDEKAALGLSCRFNLERKLAAMEGKPMKPRGVAIAPNGLAAEQPKKWEIKEARKYNPDADGLAGDEAPAIEAAATDASSKKEKEKEKKEKKDKKDKKKKLIEEVPAREAASSETVQADVEMKNDDEGEVSDDEAGSQPDEPIDETEAAVIEPTTVNPLTNGTNGVNGDAEDTHSDTIPTPSSDTPDSPDSPTAQERNWQSSILGNTKEAKKKRKIERHERTLALSAEKSAAKKARNEKLARKLDRKERREAKAKQVERRAAKDDGEYLEPAAKCGLSITRYKRKLARGEIVFGEDGSVTAISKKEIKKMKKKGEDPAKLVTEVAGKKRKRSEENGEVPESTKSEQKKKKSKA